MLTSSLGALMRILVVSDHPLFEWGMEEWLRRQTGLDVVGRAHNLKDMARGIEETQADMLLMDISEQEKDPTAALMGFLRDRLDTKVMGVNLRDGRVCIYCQQRQLMKELAGMLEVLTGQGSKPPCDATQEGGE